MVKLSPSSPPQKRQKTANAKGTCTKNKNDAFAIMRQSARVCWPTRRHLPSSLAVLEIVAANGWAPWQDQKEARQNPDHSNLRLVSRHIKDVVDRPSSGGPDFEAIVSFLNLTNRFNSLKLVGFCDHCFAHEGEGCDACDGDYTGCRCTNDHRYGRTLMQLDPRLNPEVNFEALPSRRRAALLLQFVRKVAANYHESYSQEWETLQRRLRMVVTMSHAHGGRDVGDIVAGASATMGLGEQEPNFTLMCPHMSYPTTDEFMAQFKEHNMELYNFVHHLLFTGWAEVDWFGPPGSVSPFRGTFLGDGKDYNDWNGGHREWFEEAMESFLRLHQPHDAENLPAGDRGHGLGPWCSVTQFQYIPKSIQRCIVRTTDFEAVRVLGKPLADSIDLCRPLRETYERQKERLGKVNWMPCLGMREEEFVPLRNFRGYTPTAGTCIIRGTTLWVGSV